MFDWLPGLPVEPTDVPKYKVLEDITKIEDLAEFSRAGEYSDMLRNQAGQIRKLAFPPEVQNDESWQRVSFLTDLDTSLTRVLPQSGVFQLDVESARKLSVDVDVVLKEVHGGGRQWAGEGGDATNPPKQP